MLGHVTPGPSASNRDSEPSADRVIPSLQLSATGLQIWLWLWLYAPVGVK